MLDTAALPVRDHGHPPPLPPCTLAGLMARIYSDAALPPTRRRDLVSALRRLCLLLGLDPASEPATHERVRVLLRQVTPQKAGITPKTLKNLRANLAAALRLYPVARPRGQEGLSPIWQDLRLALPLGAARYALSRFIRFCSERGIMPGTVDDDTLAAFAAHLDQETLAREPKRLVRATATHWNSAVADTPGWPGRLLAAPVGRLGYAMPWHELPEGLRREAELWLKQHATPDPFAAAGPQRALRPAPSRRVASAFASSLRRCGRWARISPGSGRSPIWRGRRSRRPHCASSGSVRERSRRPRPASWRSSS